MEPDRSTSGPAVKKFHFSELSSHVTTAGKVNPPNPKNSKIPPRTKTSEKPVDLKKCKLYELTQYNCPAPPMVKRGEKPNDIICTPFQRLFRRCARGLTVETTEWVYIPEE